MLRDGKKIPDNAIEIIPEAIERVAGDPGVTALYAMGAIAQGRLTPLSDLDFAVLLSKNLDLEALGRKHLDLIGEFNSLFHTDEIDLVLMNSAPFRHVDEIIRNGKLLYCRDQLELADFTERNLKLHLDFQFFRKEFDRTFLEGIGYIDG